MWLKLAVGLAAVYAAVVGTMALFQTHLLFPTWVAAQNPPSLPSNAERVALEAAEGVRLAGVHIPAAAGAGPSGPLLLGFGGNAWNADAMALYLHGLLPDHVVVAFHYRGYEPSTGQPSAAAVLADSLAVYDHVVETLGPERIVAVGFSIGAGAAAHLARHRPLAGAILVTPFDSLEALAREHYRWVPVGLLLRHSMPTIDLVRDSTVPMALIAAGRDTIVPPRRSAPLRDAIPNLVLDRTIAEADHNDLYDRPAFAEAMREALRRFETEGN